MGKSYRMATLGVLGVVSLGLSFLIIGTGARDATGSDEVGTSMVGLWVASDAPHAVKRLLEARNFTAWERLGVDGVTATGQAKKKKKTAKPAAKRSSLLVERKPFKLEPPKRSSSAFPKLDIKPSADLGKVELIPKGGAKLIGPDGKPLDSLKTKAKVKKGPKADKAVGYTAKLKDKGKKSKNWQKKLTPDIVKDLGKAVDKVKEKGASKNVYAIVPGKSKSKDTMNKPANFLYWLSFDRGNPSLFAIREFPRRSAVGMVPGGARN